MNTITIRVDDDLFQQIEAKRGDKSKSDFYRDILIEYLSNKPEENLNKYEYAVNITKENENLKTDLSHKDDLLRLMGERTKDLQNQLGFLQLEYQKLSTQVFKPLPEPKEEPKKWWVFWKK